MKNVAVKYSHNANAAGILPLTDIQDKLVPHFRRDNLRSDVTLSAWLKARSLGADAMLNVTYLFQVHSLDFGAIKCIRD